MRLPADQRRRQLIEVALDVFSERGFHQTSMDDVAVRAGVTKPVLYQHFPSKRALYVELLDHVGRELMDALAAATARASTGRARVEDGFAVYFRFVARRPTAFRLLFGASVRNDPEFAAVADSVLTAVAAAITELIEVDVPDEHRRVLAHALVGMAEATGRRALADPAAASDPDELARWVAEVAWFGLRGIRAEERAELT
jgi:AcrR family transcriptional regulator